MISLRAINWKKDIPFLQEVYASSRDWEMKLIPWSKEAKKIFLQQQFQAQDAHYKKYYPNAMYQIIQQNSKDVGRIYINWDEDCRIIDIAILSSFRNKGIGSKVLHDLFKEADAKNICVTIHVERENPALKLYKRLGFLPTSSNFTNEVYQFMKRPVQKG